MKNPMYVKLLKRADNTIWDGKSARDIDASRYICDNITASNRDELPSVRSLKELIGSRIDGKISVSSWLMSKGVPSEDLTSERLQAYRKEWIKLLIKEFEGKV